MDNQALMEWIALLERRIDEQEETIGGLIDIVEQQMEIIIDGRNDVQ